MKFTNVKAPVVQSRLSNQASRIEQGVKSGSLTNEEARSLASPERAAELARHLRGQAQRHLSCHTFTEGG